MSTVNLKYYASDLQFWRHFYHINKWKPNET